MRHCGRQPRPDEAAGTHHQQGSGKLQPQWCAGSDLGRDGENKKTTNQIGPDQDLTTAPPVQQRPEKGADDRVRQQHDSKTAGDGHRTCFLLGIEKDGTDQRALKGALAEGVDQADTDQSAQRGYFQQRGQPSHRRWRRIQAVPIEFTHRGGWQSRKGAHCEHGTQPWAGLLTHRCVIACSICASRCRPGGRMTSNECEC